MAEPQSARGWLSALALLGLALVLPPAVAVGLRGDEGVPRSLPVDSADATSAADAALRELNVRVHHYCGGQGTFDSISLRSAAVAVISDAAELELSATLDGAYPALLGLARGPSGKWTLVRSEPYACEIRSEGGAMAINSRAAIEKHNADPARTHERAAYKFLGGRTDSQILERLLPASSRAGVRPPGLFGATQLEAPAGVAQRFAIELEPAGAPRIPVC
ncbi:hypothetical protein T492DRAFT_841062 [Pavlovales sp. CCMP2436]|nr:hypothetical protein T492DRAFT_841062 [Pavlovales sp. CCMP2436]